MKMWKKKYGPLEIRTHDLQGKSIRSDTLACMAMAEVKNYDI